MRGDEASETLRWEPETYLKERVYFKIAAYTKKANRYRWWHTLFAIAIAIGAASVPVLINISESDFLPTLVSLIVTILVGIEGVIHFRGHWRNYDLMKTFLRTEANLFRAKAGIYKEFTSESSAFIHFVERIEEEIAKERSQTIEMRTSQSNKPSNSREQSTEQQDSDDQPATSTDSNSKGDEKAESEDLPQ